MAALRFLLLVLMIGTMLAASPASAIYHENGLPESATYLNGQLFTQSLNNRQLPYELKTTKPGGATAVWQTYVYDVRRKIDAITDSVSSVERRDYGYDANGRLISAAGPWGAGSYVYDALGNVRSWTQGSKTGTVTYGDATNRVTAYTKTGEATRNFTYDGCGNTADNDDNTFTYDFANQPVSVAGAIPATHEYDGNFKRVKTVENGKTIYQLFSRVTGGLIYRDEVTDGETTDYVSVGGAALRLKKTGATLTTEYTHFDHQGSAVAATNATGAVLWRERYSPWGTRLLKPAGNKGDAGYTGHLMDSATELVYMQARYYDSQIGRFYSTDPVGYQDQLNLYAYVGNDPVNKFDPDGTTIVVEGNEEYKAKVAADLAQVEKSKVGAEAVKQLKESKNTTTIRQPDEGKGNGADPSDWTKATDGTGTDSTIRYDPTKPKGGVDDNGSRDRPGFVGLGHEIGHAQEIDSGSVEPDAAASAAKTPGTTPSHERNSLRVENAVREAHGLTPRSNYFYKPPTDKD